MNRRTAKLVLTLFLILPAKVRAQEPQDFMFSTMAKELNRSLRELKFENFTPPYFIAYQLMDSDDLTFSARLGARVQDQPAKNRYVFVQLRYGSYASDSSDEDDSGFSDSVSLDDSETDVRHRLWLLTDKAYKQAIKDFLQKQGKKISEADKEKLDDFSKESPLVFTQAAGPKAEDPADYKRVLERASGLFNKHKEIEDSGVSLRWIRKKIYQLNSEGTKIMTEGAGNPFFIYLWARAQAEDGMNLSLSRTFSIERVGSLPSAKDLEKTINEMSERLLKLREAKVAEPYTGPAILDPESTGVLFHEAVGHRLEGERQRDEDEGQTFKGRVGKEIIPSFLSVIDDPTRKEFGGASLNGHYDVDEEGVSAQKVVLVENGILKNFLMSRRPISGFNRSNGHGRAQFGRDPIGRMSNLFVKSSKEFSRDALKKMLLKECRKQNKPYGLIVKRTRSGDTFTGRGRYQAFRGTPEEVFLVDAKTGEETLVRGVEVVGTPLITVNKIIATGKELEVLNAFCGAESGNVPVSTVAPWSLVQEIELQRVREDKTRPPILPPPLYEKN